MNLMIRKNLTLSSGATMDRRRVLGEADAYLPGNAGLVPATVTDSFSIDDARAAFQAACSPVAEQLKVVVAMG